MNPQQKDPSAVEDCDKIHAGRREPRYDLPVRCAGGHTFCLSLADAHKPTTALSVAITPAQTSAHRVEVY